MSVTVIQPGSGLIKLRVTDLRSVAWDWDKHSLRDSATISTSNFTITVVQQGGVTALTTDNASILTGAQATAACERTISDSRVTQVRLVATTATVGDEYILNNIITTNESPSQVKTGSVRVQIE